MSVTTALPISNPMRPLVATDRCDRCSAPALIRAVTPFGDLLFCRHDVRKHAAKLTEVGTVFFDIDGKVADASFL